MADRLYQKVIGKFARGQMKWQAAGGDTFRAFLVSGAYTPDTSATGHEFLADIPTNARFGNQGVSARGNATPLTLQDPTADGICTANPVTITAIPVTAPALPYVVVFKDDGVSDASSPLLLILDSLAGLPFIPNGTDVEIIWNTGPSKLWKL